MSSYSHFFSKKFQLICVSLDVNFNESLTNDAVSFEQLGPGLGLLMGKFHQFLTELPAHHRIVAGYYHFTFLFTKETTFVFCAFCLKKEIVVACL